MFVIRIQNPRRECSYLGTRGYTENPSEAQLFETTSEAHIAILSIKPFLHLEDQLWISEWVA